MSFVEVADTRVSRLHCCICLQAPTEAGAKPRAVIEDHSSNGTYVNDVRMEQGEVVVLQPGDKVSLVRCVTPWLERYFTFWEGTAASPSGQVWLFGGHVIVMSLINPVDRYVYIPGWAFPAGGIFILCLMHVDLASFIHLHHYHH